MPKAIVCVGTTQIDSSVPGLSYTVTVIGPPNFSYGSVYNVNTGISLANNLVAWRNEVIAQAAGHGVTLLAADVIVFGGPI